MRRTDYINASQPATHPA